MRYVIDKGIEEVSPYSFEVIVIWWAIGVADVSSGHGIQFEISLQFRQRQVCQYLIKVQDNIWPTTQRLDRTHRINNIGKSKGHVAANEETVPVLRRLHFVSIGSQRATELCVGRCTQPVTA